MKTLNERFSALWMRRRYEVWFLRLGLCDGSGAWWLRYLLMNPGRGGCPSDPLGQPVQVWATWFPRAGKPETVIQGFPIESLGANHAGLSKRGASPFFLEIAENRIGENECRGRIAVGDQRICWDLRYQSSFRAQLLLLATSESAGICDTNRLFARNSAARVGLVSRARLIRMRFFQARLR